MHFCLSRLADLLRKHSLEIVRSCTKNCECLCGYKLHRAQQVYNRFWGVPSSRSLLKAVRRRTILLGVSAIAVFNWETERIPDTTFEEHYKDLDQVKQLIQDTLTCRNCGHRLIADIPAPGVQYCCCGNQCLAVQGAVGGWVPFIERKDLVVWRREFGSHPGLFEYKLYGVYPEVSSDVFLQVQVDPEYRLEWDKSAVKVQLIEVDPGTHSHILYWEMKWPRFFSNREYVFNRRYLVDKQNKIVIIRCESTNHPSLPETRSKFRVKEYSCTMVIKPFKRFEEPGVEFCMTYFENSGLSLPTAIQTWVATSAMPDFLVRLRNASIQYALRRESGSRSCRNEPPMFKVVNEAVRNVS